MDQQTIDVLACLHSYQGAVFCCCFVFWYFCAHLSSREQPIKSYQKPRSDPTLPRSPLFDLLLNLGLDLQICQIPMQRLKSSSARGQLFYSTFWLACLHCKQNWPAKYPWGAQGDVVWGWRAQLGVTLLQDLLAVGYWGVNGAYLVQWIYKALEFIQTGEWKKVFQRVLAQLKGGGCLIQIWMKILPSSDFPRKTADGWLRWWRWCGFGWGEDLRASKLLPTRFLS